MSVADFIDPLIMFLGGWFAIAVGRNWSTPKPGAAPDQQARLASSAKLLRVLGPIMIVCSIIFAVVRFLTAGVS